MRLNPFDLSPHGETLVAVVVGALLATISGVAANQLEAYFRRRDRERTAALLFGEVLSGLRVLLEGADRARRIGEPYGPFTLRMLHAARREIDIYERNRESLLDLRNAALRVDVHVMMVTIAMPLDGIIDSIVNPGSADDQTRDEAFSFIIDGLAALPPLVARLGKIARHRFEDFDRIPRGAAPSTNKINPA
ncbi:MAG: hypothetical protein JWO83_4609 [Caulobacteraceae bacterium]|nr:hypothetical protein [Caulobacteraceae bacterium]